MKTRTADGEKPKRLRALFSDIDDTITTDGRITKEAFSALWAAHEAGLKVVPVTGRPAGWCDHIARMWPVAGVVGENGALYFRMTPRGMTRRDVFPAAKRRQNQARLWSVAREIMRKVHGTRLAADQPFREYDVAIDYCEDVRPLGRKAVAKIVEIFNQHGAEAKVSSVHVNGWFGRFNKLTMVRRFIADVYGVQAKQGDRRFAFVGDSPNDEPMFEFFPISFGVANVRRFLADMTHHPAHITSKAGGAGFAEVVREVLRGKR